MRNMIMPVAAMLVAGCSGMGELPGEMGMANGKGQLPPVGKCLRNAPPPVRTDEPLPIPAMTEGNHVVKDFKFSDGKTLPEVRMHYRTLGTPRTDASGRTTNAVLIMHGTGGSGNQFNVPGFAGQLFAKGQLLDAEKYFIIIPDDVGHGGSTKPSDGLHAKFPNYGYLDMIELEHRLVFDGLKVNHLRLVMGTSMGGMHTWLWGETFPGDMDALMPLASLPVQISGRNRVWRKAIIDVIRTDPEWMGGDYTKQPRSLDIANEISFFVSSNPAQRYKEAPTLKEADALLAADVTRRHTTMDANDELYAVEASHDYDPQPGLEKITAPLLAINTEDDLINPGDLDILDVQIKRVKNGRAIMIPEGPATRGHGSHTIANLWKVYLGEFLVMTEPAKK